MWEKATKRLSKYTIPGLKINFINRELEFIKLINWVTQSEIPWNFVVYGPWGCGKSEFARAFTWSLRETEDINVIYINLAEELTDIILFSKPEIEKYVKSIFKELFNKYIDVVLNLYKLIKNVHKHINLRGTRVIIIVDEVKKALNTYGETIEYLITNAESTIRRSTVELHLKSMNIIFITSEQTLIENIFKYEGKSLTTLMMWHLPKREFLKLLTSLKIPREMHETATKLSGGCPRTAIELKRVYTNDVELWLIGIIEKVITTLVKYSRTHNKTIDEIINELKAVVDNVDKITLTKAYDILLENNIITPLTVKYKHLSTIEENPSIGKRVAFQIPAYYYCIKAIVKNNSFDILTKDILNEVNTS